MRVPQAITAAALVFTAAAVEIAVARADDAASANAGREIARRYCSDCHGVDGNPTSSNFPKLAGQPISYLSKQLGEFQVKHRIDPKARFMWPEAGRLGPEQIHDVALFFNHQKMSPGEPASPEAVKEGGKIFHSGIPEKGVPACSQCHGDRGEGSEEKETPRLAGQWGHYLRGQLDVFSSEERPAAVAMHAIVPLLTTHDKDILADYLQSLPSD